jgi:hypothetical protein
VQRERRAARRARFAVNSFEALIAWLCLLTAVGFWVTPDLPGQTPVGRLIGDAGYAWVSCLFSSSVGILAGLWRGSVPLEVAGIVLLVVALVIQIVALYVVAGFASLLSIATLAGVAWACAMRAVILLRYPKAED